MAQHDGPQTEPPPTARQRLKRWFGRQSNASSSVPTESLQQPQSVTEAVSEKDHQPSDEADKALKSNIRARARSVVPGLPRTKTWGRQLSEERSHLLPVDPTPDERRAVSMDRRSRSYHVRMAPHAGLDPRTSAPGILNTAQQVSAQKFVPDEAIHLSDEEPAPAHDDEFIQGTGGQFEHNDDIHGDFSDARSTMTTQSQYELDELIHQELETTWILNLSMRYKDHSNREKFFVTYREQREDEDIWRRVTVTLDYRQAPEGSLEKEIFCTKYQRSKSAKIYEAIRESLREIQFYDTVTNLKLETINDRLHVHVVEDSNEIINYPHVNQVAHLGCRRIREQDIVFDHHMSGFVYKVGVHGQVLIKKEIPGPDTIEEFLYEVNALNSVAYSDHVINFYGLVVDENDEFVKGLLISFADGGALIDVIYDNCKVKNARGLEWSVRERWARQIVHGLADIHESGFVQGDFTLSNIVIDDNDDAKIIDVNRRGCPVGWEPPEATPLIESHHRISMYIGVKSDLFQLGMVLWALAMEEDEPEREGRPLTLGPDENIPDWYRTITELCLNPDPRKRLQASILLTLIPEELDLEPPLSVQDGESLPYLQSVDAGSDASPTRINNLSQPLLASSQLYAPSGPPLYQSWHYAPRGRSPPSPLPSNFDDGCESPHRFHSRSAWAENRNIRPSYSDVGADEMRIHNVTQQLTPSASAELKALLIGREIDDPSQRPRSMERLRPTEAPDTTEENTLETEAVAPMTPPLLVVEPAADQSTETAEKVDTESQDNPVLKEISPNIQRLQEASDGPETNTDMSATESLEPEKVHPSATTEDETPKAETITGGVGGILSAPLKHVEGHHEDGTLVDIDPSTTTDNKPTDVPAELIAEEKLTDSHTNTETNSEGLQSEPQSKSLLSEDFVVVGELNSEKSKTEQVESRGSASNPDLLDLDTTKKGEEAPASETSASEIPQVSSPEAGDEVTEQSGLVSSQAVPEEALNDEPIPKSDLVTDENMPSSSGEIPSEGAENDNGQAQEGDNVVHGVDTMEARMDRPSTELAGEAKRATEATDTNHSTPEALLVDDSEKRQAESATTAQASTIAGATWSDTQDQTRAIDQDVGHMEPYTDYSFASGMPSGGKQDAVEWAGSLAGIGAGHLALDDDLLRGAGIDDEDFQRLAQPDLQPTLITTDSNS